MQSSRSIRAEANVNCRIFPGHSQEDIRLQLIQLFNDPQLSVRYRSDAGEVMDHGSDRKSMAPPPLRTDVMESLRGVAAKLWPGSKSSLIIRASSFIISSSRR
jgi:acetylornithine deacetylase/succinyl-diaminopimelate desuccinylase-like protein